METYSSAAKNAGFAIEEVASRAFLTAHLLTGDSHEAQRATLEGINSWNGEEETGDALFQIVLTSATQSFAAAPAGMGEREGDRAYLPIELRRVLALPPGLRHCYVLHLLVALPLPDCARMLHLHSCQVVEHLLAAYSRLSVLEPEEEHNHQSRTR